VLTYVSGVTSGFAAGAAALDAYAAPMFGRARERDHVFALLDDPSVRLVSLTGRGGVGKTRLALEVARMLADARRAPVVIAPLASVGERCHLGRRNRRRCPIRPSGKRMPAARRRGRRAPSGPAP
jgi:hypothetical protein